MDARQQISLSVTVAALGDPSQALAWASANGLRGVQLSATHPATRPRDLGASARREIRSMLGRYELLLTGVDAFVPPNHFVETQHMERAIDAVQAACEFAGECGRVPVSIHLPHAIKPPDSTNSVADATIDSVSARRMESLRAIASAAQHAGVEIADTSRTVDAPWPPIGFLIDPATILGEGGDPIQQVMRAGTRLVGARIDDLLRTGMRGAVGSGGQSRLDVLAYRIALETANFTRLPVIDARQWLDPHAGVLASLRAWSDAIPG